ncbi:DnaJ-domain-containing protein [Ascoidea rubescens DSM 1968]|uniref:Diphthamide biosynthesis protein 4 n=1 Tax=Ascoidea rubescens DSM 1968 TaxID=1344418 RepID=A0A1D2VFQ1_9ASCO|nr:DnaJ-domain-containing protein [Ascoidea rubescens DSM 1968]ODV60343.1 DnaJ-domain-containing protein [Ascoidea rubescens DSM 1968]
MEQNHYHVLGVASDADAAQIKAAYKHQLFEHHPDKAGSAGDDAIPKIQQAYQVLSRPEQRRRYDERLVQQMKHRGVVSDGDGLDVVDLDSFSVLEDEMVWVRSCPRCRNKEGMVLAEEDLENNASHQHSDSASRDNDNDNEYSIAVQCSSCSLWVQVRYFDSM